jgi:hypothetical protein
MDVFKSVLFLLAIVTSLACMVLLFRGYMRSGLRILMWSALCFVCLSINNILLYIELVLLPTNMDLRMFRYGSALVGMLFLIYGFIRESE